MDGNLTPQTIPKNTLNPGAGFRPEGKRLAAVGNALPLCFAIRGVKRQITRFL
jgi:hypothetical protein